MTLIQYLILNLTTAVR